MSTPQIKKHSIHSRRRIQKRRVKKEIRNILPQFKSAELLSDKIVSLFELNPEEVRDKLYELKLPAKKDCVADLLTHRAQSFTTQELEDIYYFLMLYRSVFKQKLKTWTTVSLLEPAEDFQCYRDVKTISLYILQSLRIKGLNAVVKVIEHEELFWVMIIEKKLTRRNGIKLQGPVFFCFELGQPFLFFNSKVSDSMMSCILGALQYKRHKVQHLQGRDVKSLLALLTHRAEHQDTAGPTTLLTDKPDVGYRYIDYSKRKTRKAYAEEVFKTKEPIYLDTLTVNADAVWRDTTLVPSMAGEPFRATLQLKSKNLFEMIKYAVTNDMVATPIPYYLSSILHSGKNNINMRFPQSKQ